MNSVRTNNKFEKSKVSKLGCKDMESRKFEFVVTTQFLYRDCHSVIVILRNPPLKDEPSQLTTLPFIIHQHLKNRTTKLNLALVLQQIFFR